MVIIVVLTAISLPVYYSLTTYNTVSTSHLVNKARNRTHSTTSNSVEYGKDDCKRLRKPSENEILYRNKHWQAYQDEKEDLVVYSAFFDDRQVVGNSVSIRILGVRRLSDRPVWCYVWYAQTETPDIVEAEATKTGREHKIKGGRSYDQRLFTCQLGDFQSVPTHASLVVRRCAKPTIFLPVVIPERLENLNDNLGVCLKVTFGYFQPEWIVEWMESQFMFGITSVNLCNATLDGRLDRVVDYYVRRGLVNVLQIPPATDDLSVEGIRLGSSASLNDCMLRNMYSLRFILVIDFDEIIVPRIHADYRDLIQHVDSSLDLENSHHTYSFRNAYFFQHFPEDASQPASLKTLRFRHRTPPSDYLLGTKSFVDPRRCKSVFNHYCWIRFDDANSTSVDVNATLGLSHHYRTDCPFEKAECAEYDAKKTVDNVMLKFKTKLLARVSRTLAEIGINASSSSSSSLLNF